MSKKIFSGVQPTGNLHLGNYLGAIKNFVDLNNDIENKCIFCVVDLHAITIKQNPKELKDNIRETVATFLASGIDPKKSIIFNQSNVASHAEGAWILSCVARMGWLNRMTQFKEKAGKDKEKASVGLYSYPVLMAADILLYDAEIVPVGKDQLQHLEITRNVANRFHNIFGETFVLPKGYLQEESQLVTGTDGEKMSKSKNNIINIFASESELKKQIQSIETDSSSLESPKDWQKCNLFNLYKLIADEDQIEKMKANYEAGGYGYGHAKKDFQELILKKYSLERNKFNHYISSPNEVEGILKQGASKARITADEVLNRVRKKLGY